MSYDENARRDTPLALKLKERIRKCGEIALADFVSDCLWDETHGYYATKTVLGRTGDFVTAPEISQVFGELLGLWCVVAWQQIGAPNEVNLVELGPGRGTLMADMLRAIASVPKMKTATTVTLIERSASLRTHQQTTLADAAVPIAWQEDWQVSTMPAIVIANEFIDVFGPDQSIKTDDGWRWRAVVLDAMGRFQFAPTQTTRLRPELDALWPGAAQESVFEHLRTGDLASLLKRMAGPQPLAALFVDYGHTQPALGETLQAVRNHAYEHPLCSPGEADLTVQVDFSDVAAEMKKQGFAVDGPVTQAEFLGRLGIIERASKLMGANPAKAGEIEAGVMRLMAPNGMGTRFKAIGIRSPGLPALPGF